MKRIIPICLAFVLVIALIGCGLNTAPIQSASLNADVSAATSKVSPSELTIAAAASLTIPLNEIIANYAAVAPNVKITATYGASGTLQTQIEQGAPADIFFPAALKQMDALDKSGLVVTSSKVDLLKNEIVLIVPSALPVKIGSFADLNTNGAAKIALGDPKSVPAGQYAEETLTYLKLWDKVSGKANFGSDVKQVLTWVESGNVDCGIVYKTDALMNKNVKIIAEAPNGSHAPVVYPIAIVKASANQIAAGDFIKYLQSDNGRNVFTKYGFAAG